jgi:hypothetical protein
MWTCRAQPHSGRLHSSALPTKGHPIVRKPPQCPSPEKQPGTASMLPFTSRCLRFRPPPKALKPALVSFSCRGRASPGETAAGFDNCSATITADLQANGADFPVSLGHMPGKAFGGLNHQAHPAQIADGSLESYGLVTEAAIAQLRHFVHRKPGHRKRPMRGVVNEVVLNQARCHPARRTLSHQRTFNKRVSRDVERAACNG